MGASVLSDSLQLSLYVLVSEKTVNSIFIGISASGYYYDAVGG